MNKDSIEIDKAPWPRPSPNALDSIQTDNNLIEIDKDLVVLFLYEK